MALEELHNSYFATEVANNINTQQKMITVFSRTSSSDNSFFEPSSTNHDDYSLFIFYTYTIVRIEDQRS